MTNSDKIRSMSDEELAEFLNEDASYTCYICARRDAKDSCVDYECKNLVLEWLKQEVSKNVGTDLIGTERRMKTTYNTISLLDKEGQMQIFGIMKITLKEHLEQAIQRGCELCKEHGADGFRINYIQAEFPWERSVYYDVHGNEISVEV